MSATDELLANNAKYATSFEEGELPAAPVMKVAVVACMDARLDVYAILGLQEGDAHVIRNAGGVVTDDAIRSLAISQHQLGTEEIVLIHHTGCGMLTVTDEELAAKLEKHAGERPPWHAHAIDDLEDSLRESIRRVRESPFLASRNVRGFVYEVETGRLREVA